MPPSPARRLACPRCGDLELAPASADMFSCTGCGGVFVHREGVPRLARSLIDGQAAGFMAMGGSPYRSAAGIEAAVRSDAVAYLKCPFDDAQMNRERLSDRLEVIVDVCLVHGLWFDAGELARWAQLGAPGPKQARADAAGDLRLQRLLALFRVATPS